jgi:hypothetical protein
MANLSAGYENNNFKCFRQKDKDGDMRVIEFFDGLGYSYVNPKRRKSSK